MTAIIFATVARASHSQINCIFIYLFFFFSDANHFAPRVQKAASPDMWDLGVLIHNFFIIDVTREEMI